MKKQSRLVIQKRRIPEPLAFFKSCVAIHRKKPKLSKEIAMTIVAIIVMAAPLTFDPISTKSARVTLPHKNMTNAPTDVGIASFRPLGLHRTSTMVTKKKEW